MIAHFEPLVVLLSLVEGMPLPHLPRVAAGPMFTPTT